MISVYDMCSGQLLCRESAGYRSKGDQDPAADAQQGSRPESRVDQLVPEPMLGLLPVPVDE